VCAEADPQMRCSARAGFNSPSGTSSRPFSAMIVRLEVRDYRHCSVVVEGRGSGGADSGADPLDARLEYGKVFKKARYQILG
jgi:hypothetical protein